MRLSSMKLVRSLLMLCSLTLVLAGCGLGDAAKKIWEVVKDPDVQVGEEDEQKSLVTLMVHHEAGANMNDFGEPAPVDLWIFQLTDKDKFADAEYWELTSKPRNALDNEFVDMVEETFKPGETRTIGEIELEPKTSYIGVVTGFANLSESQWRTVKKVRAVGKKYDALILTFDQTTSIKLEEL